MQELRENQVLLEKNQTFLVPDLIEQLWLLSQDCKKKRKTMKNWLWWLHLVLQMPHRAVKFTTPVFSREAGKVSLSSAFSSGSPITSTTVKSRDLNITYEMSTTLGTPDSCMFIFSTRLGKTWKKNLSCHKYHFKHQSQEFNGFKLKSECIYRELPV